MPVFMKMIFLEYVVLAVCSASVAAVAQATFALQNLDPNTPVYDWTGNPLCGADWRIELYGAAEANSLSPVVAFGGSSEPIIIPLVGPGYFQYRSSAGDPAVISVPAGGWAWLQVKVWDLQLGATYEQALARGQGGYGQSALFYAQGGNPVASTPTAPQPLTGLASFSVLQPVPEASTWALLALGLGALVCCRGR